MVLRTEGVSCEEITAFDHADLARGIPAPDCRKIYDAWSRGRTAVSQLPEYGSKALDVKMSFVVFYRPTLIFVPEKPYPIINIGTKDYPYLVRALTSPAGPVFIQYSYEETIEHETPHAIIRFLDSGRERKPEDIVADPGVEPSQPPLIYFYQIVCHNTPDDPIGKGPLGNRTDCSKPYSGPDVQRWLN